MTSWKRRERGGCRISLQVQSLLEPVILRRRPSKSAQSGMRKTHEVSGVIASSQKSSCSTKLEPVITTAAQERVACLLHLMMSLGSKCPISLLLRHESLQHGSLDAGGISPQKRVRLAQTGGSLASSSSSSSTGSHGQQSLVELPLVVLRHVSGRGCQGRCYGICHEVSILELARWTQGIRKVVASHLLVLLLLLYVLHVS